MFQHEAEPTEPTEAEGEDALKTSQSLNILASWFLLWKERKCGSPVLLSIEVWILVSGSSFYWSVKSNLETLVCHQPPPTHPIQKCFDHNCFLLPWLLWLLEESWLYWGVVCCCSKLWGNWKRRDPHKSIAQKIRPLTGGMWCSLLDGLLGWKGFISGVCEMWRCIWKRLKGFSTLAPSPSSQRRTKQQVT